MAIRTLFVLAVAVAACKGSGDAAKPGDLGARCEQLAKACGDNDKHVTAILDGCKQAATTQTNCAAQVSALYDCYQSFLCGKSDRVWAMEDLGVLAQRKALCGTQLQAVAACK